MATERKSVDEPPKIDDDSLKVGAGVELTKNRAGIIRYRGAIQGEKGIWFGIELIAGNSDKKGANGVKAKKRYFFAPGGRAVFCQAETIKRVLSKVNQNTMYNIVDPLERLEARTPQDWSVNDVGRWLAKIDALEAITIFLVNNVDGVQLMRMTEKELEGKLSIKDKDLRKTILDNRKKVSGRVAPLPDLDEVAELKTSLEEAPPSDTILAPPLQNLGTLLGNESGEPWRFRSKSSPLVKKSPRKRDSYSVPEKLRGKLPGPFGRGKGHRQPRGQFPPPRGSFRDENRKVLLPPSVTRFHSTPVIGADEMTEMKSDRDADAEYQQSGFEKRTKKPSAEHALSIGNALKTLNEQGDAKDGFGQVSPEGGADSADKKKGHKRTSSLTDFIESNPMAEWPVEICAKWINSLGGKTSTYGTLFREKKVTGKQLEDLSAEALLAIGVKEPGVRKWILTQRDTVLRKALSSKPPS